MARLPRSKNSLAIAQRIAKIGLALGRFELNPPGNGWVFS
jgi:hypothetical protein